MALTNKVRLPFNINDYVYVRFLPGAYPMMVKKWQGVADITNEPVEKILDGQYPGWRTGKPVPMQLWCFIELVGPSTHNGMQDVYSNTIEVEFELTALAAAKAGINMVGG